MFAIEGNYVVFGHLRAGYQLVTNPGYTFGLPQRIYEKKKLNCISFPAATE